jgi:4-hydroxy-3-polyprenylbenzoate decarboxylase
MCLAFGVDALDDVAAKLGDVLEMQPPQGLVEKVRGLQKLKSSRLTSRPSTVRTGPAEEVVLRGDDSTSAGCRSDLLARRRRRRSSHLPAVITRDPRTGAAQRRHVPPPGARPPLDAMHWQITGRAAPTDLFRRRKDGGGRRDRLDPVTAYSASAPLPKHIDELMLAASCAGPVR